MLEISCSHQKLSTHKTPMQATEGAPVFSGSVYQLWLLLKLIFSNRSGAKENVWSPEHGA